MLPAFSPFNAEQFRKAGVHDWLATVDACGDDITRTKNTCTKQCRPVTKNLLLLYFIVFFFNAELNQVRCLHAK